MKRTTVIICISLFISLCCVADDYIIKYMNGPLIHIGVKKRECKVGSIFSSNEEIHWSKDVTLIEAQDVKTKRTVYFPSPLCNANNRSTNFFQRLWNYFVKVTHQSTRETHTYDLEETLTNEDFPLLDENDTIRIRTNDIENRKYYASFYLNGQKRIIPLDVENGEIIFERSKFIFDGVKYPYNFVLTIYYKDDDLYHEITKGMILTVFDVDN